MRTLTVLDDLRIATPCPASWEAMRGDERVRYCGLCSKHVYDMSGLTADESVKLVQKAEGHVCMRLYRRKDGTFLTADCPVGIRGRVRRRVNRMIAAAVLMSVAARAVIYAEEYAKWNIPPMPLSPGATLGDWVGWAKDALGIRPAYCEVEAGMISISRPPPQGITAGETISSDEL